MAGRWALRVLRVGLFALLLFAGWKLRAHVGETWTFVGSDGFFYLGAAEELHQSQRYAMRPPQWVPAREVPQPLTYCRVPGLAVVMSWLAPPLPVKSYEPWYARIKPVQRVLDLTTCCLVFALGLSLFGWSVAWIGFALALGHPVLAMYSASMFSETLATTLTTAVLLLCAAAVTGRRSRRGFCALLFGGAACAGLATLVRIDSLILIAPIGLAPLLRSETWRARIVQLVGAAAIFLVVLSPWLVRNQLAFGKPHLSGALCDTQGQPVTQTGFARWMSTWLTQEEQLPQTLWCYLRVGCRWNVAYFPPEAFSSPAERHTVEQLAAWRAVEGTSQRVDDGFAALAAMRRRAEPYRTLVGVPLERARRLWLNKNDLPLRSTPPFTWPKFLTRVEPKLLQMALLIDELALCGMVFCLILPAFSAMRSAVLLLALTIVLRTAALAYTGSTEGRYLLEIVPVLLMFCGAAFAVPFRVTSSFLR